MTTRCVNQSQVRPSHGSTSLRARLRQHRPHRHPRPTTPRTRADELAQLAAHVPDLVSKRLRAKADRLRKTADTHDATAHPAEALT